MKPRLKPQPLTEEDQCIWFDWQINRCHDWALWAALWDASRQSDRRDADLMLKAQRQRQWLEVEDGSCGPDFCLPPWFMPFEWECGPVGGDITPYITNFA